MDGKFKVFHEDKGSVITKGGFAAKGIYIMVVVTDEWNVGIVSREQAQKNWGEHIAMVLNKWWGYEK